MVEKSTLSCTHCNSMSSHNTAACRKKDRVKKKQKSPSSSPHRDRFQSPAAGKRSPTPAAAALKSNSATIKHTLNRVSIKFRQMDVKNQSFKVNSSFSSTNGSLRTMIAKMSSARTGKTSKERITLDMGATCSIKKLSIAKKLHLDVRPAPGVTITGAGGEDLKVASQTDVFFSVFNNSPMRLHLFVCDDLKEDVLISADHLEALGLIPQQWPECMNPHHKQYSNNYTAATAAAAATEEEPEEEEDSGVESEPKEKKSDIKNDESPLSIPRTHLNLDKELWSYCGEVHDIPHIEDYPASTRAILFKYGDVFKNSLSKARKIKCKPVHLEIDPDIPVPPPATKCCTVPLHWCSQYEELLDTLISEGIIKKQEDVTTFVAPSFMVTKAHDPSRGRMIQDFSQGINKCLRCTCTPIPAPWQVWAKVSLGSKCFFSANLSASYYQIPLDEASQPLTCFFTDRGRFVMTRLAMGLSASSDAFNHKVGDIFDAFPNLRLAWEIDDLLVHCESMAKLHEQLEHLLKICREHQLTLSPRKFQMCDKNGSLIFAGYKLSAAGCEPDPTAWPPSRTSHAQRTASSSSHFLG